MTYAEAFPATAANECTRWRVLERHRASVIAANMTFHDLSATGITWGAVRGDNPHVLQMAAGHESFTTTQEYIREAEIHRAGFGQVFPPLPESFLRDLRGVQITPNSVPLSQETSVLPGEFAPRSLPLRERVS